MNKKIKEIEEKAELYANEQWATDDVAKEDCFRTKFAELIILECRSRATEFGVLSEEIGEYLDELLI
jgi:hypothetical protein